MSDDAFNDRCAASEASEPALDAAERAFVDALRAPVAVDTRVFDARVMTALCDAQKRKLVPVHALLVSARMSAHRARAPRLWIAGAAVAALAAALVVLLPVRRAAVSPANRAGQVGGSGATGSTRAEPIVMQRSVRFTLVAPGASRVSIAGSFNGWSTASMPLRRVDPDTWTADIPLGAGRYVYQFVIDGTKWIPDPRAPRDAGDDFGTRNSVITVTAPGAA